MSRGAGFEIGDRVGPYELVAHVGSGGFASVWLGRRRGPGGFEVRVALKLMRIEHVNDAAFENMFIDEAKVAALIDHPNVVKIFELGTESGTLYMAMEYVRGRPLSALRNLAQRAGRRVPVEIMMRVLSDTCAGLHAAHELTRDGRPLCVIHRDVSPENILVSDRGIVKLIDFGVAKANDRLATDTATGFAKGKVRYMSPEQALAKPLDRRADIWALGAVAFEVLQGSPPFDAENDFARLMLLVGSSPVPPLDPSIPSAYAAIVHKALSRDIELRYPTAEAMRSAIESALAESGAHVTADALATFFGEWMHDELEGDDDDEVDSRDELRARLAGSAVNETTDIHHQKRHLASDNSTTNEVAVAPRPVETLGAVNSSLMIAAASPRSQWRLTAIALGAVAFGAMTVLWFGTRSPVLAPPSPTLASESLPAPTPRASTLEVALPPASDVAAPQPPQASAANVDLDHVHVPVASAPGSAVPTAQPKRRPTFPPKKPRSTATPTPRPRYDDTIQ